MIGRLSGELVHREGNLIIYKGIVHAISAVISKLFRFYADLRPTTHIVEGTLLPWASVFGAAGVLGLLAGGLYVFGVVAMRRRELAEYGQSLDTLERVGGVPQSVCFDGHFRASRASE